MPSPSARVRRRWAFRGSPLSRSRDERERFADRIAGAVRLAGGWPVDLTIVWTTGPSASVELEANDPPTERWVASSLVPAYPPGCWIPSNGPARDHGVPVAFGRAAFGPERPFRVGSPSTNPWSDSVVAALFLLPSGHRAEWRLRPLGTPRSPPPRPAGTAQPPGFRLDPPPSATRRLADQMAERTVAPQWEARVELFGPDWEAARAFARLIEAASREDGGNGIVWRSRGRWLGRSAPGVTLASGEVVPLLPSSWLRVPTPPPAGGATRWAIPLGRSPSGEMWSVPVDPHQGRHALLLGETGMGKSSLLIRSAVRASELGSLVFFDPIGDTSRRLIDRLGPAALGRIVWISPGLSPVGINALGPVARPSPAGERALGDLVAALRRVRVGRYADSPFWGPRVEEMLTLSLRAAARYPDGTLRDAAEILTAAGGRIVGVPPDAEDAVRALAERVRSRPDEVDGARRVLEEVVGTPILARMLASEGSAFAIGEAIRAGQIVILSGDAAEVGESVARTLLSVHLALLWGEILTGPKGTKTFVFADEIQWYANDAVGELFRLGRRFNVHVWAATQSLAALPEGTREAAVTNAADVVSFRGSPDDARELARWSADVPVESLLALRRGEAVVLLGKGSAVSWLRLPFEPDRPRPGRYRTVWEQCRGLWAPAEPVASLPSGADDPPAGPDEGPDPLRPLLLVLWAGLLSAGSSDSIELGLDDLRSTVGADAALVRSLGQRLSAIGALVAADGPNGRRWTVRRERFSELLEGGVNPADLAAADAVWNRLRRLSDRSESRKGL
jgi:hypothetical protein